MVENRAGAGGSIGTNYVAKAAPDGYTLLLGTVSSIAVNAALYAKLPFDVDKDLQPITQLVSFPNLLFVNPKLPVKTVPELVAYLKANEGKANYGSSGLGTSGHLSVVMFERATGTKMTHIPYKSTGDVVNSHARRQHRSRHRQHDHGVAARQARHRAPARRLDAAAQRHGAGRAGDRRDGEGLSRRPRGRACSRRRACRSRSSRRSRPRPSASGISRR